MAAARRALDNGGRLWNLFDHAGDEQVSRVELEKAAGVFGQAAAFLHYELATAALSEEEREELWELLAPEVRRSARFYRPEVVSPGELAEVGRAGRPYVAEGTLRRLDKVELPYEVTTMIWAGSVMIPVVSPLVAMYRTYELRRRGGGCCLVIPKGLGPERPARFAGLMKRLDGAVHTGTREKQKLLYFAPRFYSDLE